jgi:hypothetical protein
VEVVAENGVVSQPRFEIHRKFQSKAADNVATPRRPYNKKNRLTGNYAERQHFPRFPSVSGFAALICDCTVPISRDHSWPSPKWSS